MTDELREAAEIAGTRAFPAHPHFRGTGADLYIAGYEAGKPKWIPIRSADDLPKEDGWFAVTINDGDGFPDLVEPFWWNGAEWTDGDNIGDSTIRNHQTVLAYQPLPEPYTEGE